MFLKKDQISQVLEEFITLQEWEDKYLALVELGRLVPEISEIRKPENLVSGCSSKVWIDLSIKNNIVDLKINSSSIIVSGLMAILLLHLDQKKYEEVINFKFSDLNYLNLDKYLSINRQNGFLASFKRIKQLLITSKL